MAVRTLDSRFFANPVTPLISTGWCVARFAGGFAFPTDGVNIAPPPETDGETVPLFQRWWKAVMAQASGEAVAAVSGCRHSIPCCSNRAIRRAFSASRAASVFLLAHMGTDATSIRTIQIIDAVFVWEFQAEPLARRLSILHHPSGSQRYTS